MIIDKKHPDYDSVKLVDAADRQLNLAVVSFDTSTNECEFYVTVNDNDNDKDKKHSRKIIALSEKTGPANGGAGSYSIKNMIVRVILEGARLVYKDGAEYEG